MKKKEMLRTTLSCQETLQINGCVAMQGGKARAANSFRSLLSDLQG
jgi:hypothetical protein